jgi:ABC-type multidrug transport system fused ATPase/permease subunit
MKFSNKQIISQVFKFTAPFRSTLVLIFLMIMLTISIEALNTYFLSKVFDIAQLNGDLKQALFWAVMACLLVMSRIVITKIRETIEVKKLDVHLDNFLNEQSIEKFFSFSNGQHINEHSGVKQNIVQSGFGSIHNQMNTFIYNFIPSISLFIMSIVVLFSINVYIGISYIFASFFFGRSLVNFNKIIDPKVRDVRDARNKNSRFISEIYRFVFLIKNEVAEKKSLSSLKKIQGHHQDLYSETWLDGINRLMLIRFSTHIFRWMTIFASIYLVVNGNITSGKLFMVFVWTGNFIDSVWNLTNMQKNFITDKINIEKYFELLNLEPDIKQKKDAQKIGKIESIKYKNVHFSYPRRVKDVDSGSGDIKNDEYVLCGIDIEIKSGEKVAFVGESGSGKSTIANLLRRGFDPQIGQIIINDVDIRDIELDSFLNKIGSVDQEVILFDTSIRDNISLGIDRVLTDEELDTLAKMSGVHKFKHKLEWGWDTVIGERGCKLSGGEKQRIGIARALAKNPDILLFDEATSALDTLSEVEVQEAIDLVSLGKTTIIIAHRLSTIKDCDKIFVMKSGKILNVGKHSELLKNCDYYKKLVNNQLTNSTV